MSSHPPSYMTVVRSSDFAAQLTAALLTAALPLACAAWVMAALMALGSKAGSKAESRPAAAAVRHSRLSASDCAASALGMLLAARKAGEQRSWGRWMSKKDAGQPSRMCRGDTLLCYCRRKPQASNCSSPLTQQALPPNVDGGIVGLQQHSHMVSIRIQLAVYYKQHSRR